MDVYAMESALLRTQKLIIDRGQDKAAVQIEIVRVFARDAAARVERAARIVVTEAESDDKTAAVIERLVHRAPIKLIAARANTPCQLGRAVKYNLSASLYLHHNHHH